MYTFIVWADYALFAQPVNIVAGVCFIIGGGLMAGAVDVAMLVVGRIFLGFGVGLCSLVSCLFSSLLFWISLLLSV